MAFMVSHGLFLEKPCTKARDFIDYLVKDEHFASTSILGAVRWGRNCHLFRGQAKITPDWKLTPKVFRKPDSLDN
jgi:hypothetical protein